MLAALVLSVVTAITRADIDPSAATGSDRRGHQPGVTGSGTAARDAAGPLRSMGRCLTPSRRWGHPVMRECRGSRKQQWSVRGTTIRNAAGRCLTAPVRRHRYVYRGECREGVPGQSWTFDGTALVSGAGGCLTIVPGPDDSRKRSRWRQAGAKVVTCSGAAEQRWNWGGPAMPSGGPSPSPTDEPTSSESPSPTASPAPSGNPSPIPPTAPAPPPTEPPGPGTGSFDLAWQSDFDGPLSRGDWNIYDTRRPKSSRCYWAGNTSVSEGILRLRAGKAAGGACAGNFVASAGLDTGANHLIDGGGRWEVRAKVAGGPDASGKPTSYGFDSYVGIFPLAADWSYEIDFIENITREPRSMHLTQHWQQAAGRRSVQPVHQGDWSSRFHTYALEVLPAKGSTPGVVKYYIDGELAGTQELMFELKDAKLGIGYIDGECDRWIGCPADAAAKGYDRYSPDDALEIDWVKIYEYTG
ncbi:MAG: ricin-type beta-trefoil lectin domain protein [Nocardioides sp.]